MSIEKAIRPDTYTCFHNYEKLHVNTPITERESVIILQAEAEKNVNVCSAVHRGRGGCPEFCQIRDLVKEADKILSKY